MEVMTFWCCSDAKQRPLLIKLDSAVIHTFKLQNLLTNFEVTFINILENKYIFNIVWKRKKGGIAGQKHLVSFVQIYSKYYTLFVKIYVLENS